MIDRFQNKYRISSARLQTWDYGSNAAYFISICTKNRECYFGTITNHEMQLNQMGLFAEKYWSEIPNHFPFIELGNFVIMPNHVHGILIIDKMESDMEYGSESISDTGETRQCLVSTIRPIPTPTSAPSAEKTFGQLRYQNQGKNTISSIIGSYKSVVTKNIHTINVGFGWQPRFHDHIIRDSQSFENIQNYIANNPFNWKIDKFHS